MALNRSISWCKLLQQLLQLQLLQKSPLAKQSQYLGRDAQCEPECRWHSQAVTGKAGVQEKGGHRASARMTLI